jgi:hypothetical protein
MKQYYNNSLVTFIAIDGEIGDEVKESEAESAKHIIQQIFNSS